MTKTYKVPKDELTAYYNDVEESIICIFGSFEKAAEWFDKHPVALNSLFAYCKEKYTVGWSASRASNEWYRENVAEFPITKYPSPILPIPATKYVYQPEPTIEPKILAARLARTDAWHNSYLVDRS